jgi:hypothetical protein
MNATLNDDFLQAMRSETDPPADQVIQHVLSNENTEAIHELMSAISKNNALLPDNLPAPAIAFFEQTVELPAWANHKWMREGSLFFAKHAQPILSALGSLSLPYCYAAADGAQVLFLSQRIRKDTKKRLSDTGQFVLNVMQKGAFDEKGTGIRTIQKVRLMHAAVRFHVLKSKQWNDVWGKPVNQEDMAGTNLAFSFIVLEGLQKMGIYYSSQEANAYLHLWNVIGYMLGVGTILLPDTMKDAYRLGKLIEKRHFRKSEAGIELTKALLQSFEELTPNPALAGFAPAYMRFLLGDRIADLLEIPKTSLPKIAFSPLRAFNVAKSITSSFRVKDASDFASHAILIAIEEENGKADFKLPVTLT